LTDKRRVLVVDDEEVVLASVEKLLGKDDMLVDKVGDAETALLRLRERRFDVVITDLMMPKIDGLELLRRIRSEGHSVPTILITGYATIRSAMDALKAGAVEYLPKPFTRSELRGAIARALRRRALSPGAGASPTLRPSHGPVDGQAGEGGAVYRLPEHTWLRIEEKRVVVVGMDYLFSQMIGQLLSIDMPSTDEFVEQGRACFMAVDREGISHFLCSPVSGKVIEVNPGVAAEPNLVHEQPEGDGWLITVRPADLGRELKNLVPDGG
jgi:CheY-like chemotaxis protein/glycine cleavage system H lipoate-binding protein